MDRPAKQYTGWFRRNLRDFRKW